MGHRQIIRYGFTLLLLFAIAAFFIRAFQGNWSDIRSYNLKLDASFVFMSFAAITINYFLVTYSWFVALNALSGGDKISFTESVATVNASNLTKYIPGKVWSYAMQMFLLAKAGFSKSLILYVNLLIIYVSLMTSMMLGLCFLIFSRAILPLAVALSLLAGLVLFDLLLINFNSQISKKSIAVINRIFKRDIRYFETSGKLFMFLHAINFIAAFCFGMGGYLLCFGIGFDVNGGKIFSVMSAMLISDVIGFLAVFVPGGLGVREGVMYLLLNGVSSKALSIVLPIGTRLVSMIVDIILGTIGFLLLKKFKRAASTIADQGKVTQTDFKPSD
jgi:uncharacterized membrane protein YbhN (UPF0104 family)